MTLKDEIRKIEIFGIKTEISRSIYYPTLGLLRKVGLLALTHTEHQNAIADPVVSTPEILKLFPLSDVLFPFSNGGKSFPLRDVSFSTDSNRANQEFNFQQKSEQFFKDFFTADQLDAAWTTELQAKIREGLPANYNGTLTYTTILNQYNQYNYKTYSTTQNLFDQINAFRNIYKQLVKLNIDFIKSTNRLRSKTNDSKKKEDKKKDRLISNTTVMDALGTALVNQGISTNVNVNFAGNMGTIKIPSWGAYADDESATIDGFKILKDHFQNKALLSTEDSKVLKDLYILECIREPSALITNAMFIELNKKDIKLLPVAQERFVGFNRATIWKTITGKNHNFYYPYDYSSNDPGSFSAYGGATEESILENNLLYEYLISLDNKEVVKNNKTITSFPLRLIFDLLKRWYHVDLAATNPALANLKIEIDLNLIE